MITTPDYTPDYAAYEARQAAFNARRAALAPAYKAALFAALAAGGVHTVVIAFDGYGDSGQIESVTGFADGETEVTLPNTPIEIQEPHFNDEAITRVMCTPHDVLEKMAYDFLEDAHGGWENNDGAYGAFTFAVREQTITLDYNERFTESTYYRHEF